MLEIRLKTHREKMARIAVLELEIQGLEEEIEKSTGIHETDDETIEGMAFRRSLEGGGGGDNTSKVEKVAMNFRTEQERLQKPQDVSYLYSQIKDKQGELKRLKDETLPIEKALQGITDKQKLIITEFYLRGNSWYTVGVRHQQAFGQFIQKDTCKKIRSAALDKMNRILGW